MKRLFLSILMVLFSAGASANESSLLDQCNGASPIIELSTTVYACTKGSELRVYWADALPGVYLELEHKSLEEWDGDEKIWDVKLKGHDNFWSEELVEQDGLYTAGYSGAALNSYGSYVNYQINTSFGTERSTLVLNGVACTECASYTAGKCQNARGICREMNYTGQCPRRFSTCSTAVVSEKDIFTVALSVSEWVFEKPTNTLRYTMKLKAKKDKEIFPLTDDQVDPEIDMRLLTESGLLLLPSVALLYGPGGTATAVEVNITHTMKKNNKSGLITFEFPAMSDGTQLYYQRR